MRYKYDAITQQYMPSGHATRYAITRSWINHTSSIYSTFFAPFFMLIGLASSTGATELSPASSAATTGRAANEACEA